MKFWRAAAWVATGPAVYVNIEAMPMPWTPFAIGSVIFAAVFVFLAWEKRSFWYGALSAVFISINLATALGNVATISADTIDGRNSIVQRREAINARRADLNKRRKVQTEIAGEEAAQTIESNLQGIIASDATRWKASEHCNPDKMAQAETRAFCNSLAELQGKKAAATERDKIDAKLSEIDKETIFGGPSATDPYAESLARFLTVFGWKFDDEGKILLSASKDWGKAIGLEAMAAFGPMGLTALFQILLLTSSLSAPARAEEREHIEADTPPAAPMLPPSGPKPRKPKLVEPSTTALALSTIDAVQAQERARTMLTRPVGPVEAFYADWTKPSVGAEHAAADFRHAYLAWCRAKGFEPVGTRTFRDESNRFVRKAKSKRGDLKNRIVYHDRVIRGLVPSSAAA